MECAHDQPIRVIITDHDFDMNYKSAKENVSIVAEAVAHSPHLVLMLHAAEPSWTEAYKSTGARVIAVKELNDYPAMAAALSNALFERSDRVAH
jgi:indole-3-glycerol phosphate synthase